MFEDPCTGGKVSERHPKPAAASPLKGGRCCTPKHESLLVGPPLSLHRTARLQPESLNFHPLSSLKHFVPSALRPSPPLPDSRSLSQLLEHSDGLALDAAAELAALPGAKQLHEVLPEPGFSA